jgi:glycosyltransferase involved in cell wall biosynthesis
MKVSVIIPTYNNVEKLKVTLSGLEKQTFPKDDFEVVTVIDGSNDGTSGFLKAYEGMIELKYMFQENKGQATARNMAVKISSGELLILVDDDCFCPAEFIEKHVSFHTDHGKGNVLFGQIKHIPSINFDAIFVLINEGKLDELDMFKEKDLYFDLRNLIWEKNYSNIKWICSTAANTSVEKAVFESAGMFDENFIGWGLEDCELGYRFYKSGINLFYDENVFLYHLDKQRAQYNLHSQLAKNLKYWRQKYRGNKEINSYISFICNGLSLQELNHICSGNRLGFEPEGEQIFFTPFEFFSAKEKKT